MRVGGLEWEVGGWRLEVGGRLLGFGKNSKLDIHYWVFDILQSFDLRIMNKDFRSMI
jgi:hypothetical protein